MLLSFIQHASNGQKRFCIAMLSHKGKATNFRSFFIITLQCTSIANDGQTRHILACSNSRIISIKFILYHKLLEVSIVVFAKLSAIHTPTMLNYKILESLSDHIRSNQMIYCCNSRHGNCAVRVKWSGYVGLRHQHSQGQIVRVRCH